jgi:DNA mismatch repair ATPase MutS
MSWTPFASLSTALESAGVLGSLSTFEAEIEFAKSVLAPADGPRFVMMDEIFHSTNATDGLAASQVFLTQLYQTSDILSIVSTHYKDLADTYKESATPLCMEATEKEDKTLAYTYKVVAGTSDKSSVMEILKERGLCR